MGKEKDTATVVLDDDLVKEIIEGGEGRSDGEGRVVRIDPASRSGRSRPGRRRGLSALEAASHRPRPAGVGAGPAAACNPDPPLPPILEGHAYDRVAMEYLIRDAVTIGIARYVGRVDYSWKKVCGPETGPATSSICGKAGRIPFLPGLLSPATGSRAITAPRGRFLSRLPGRHRAPLCPPRRERGAGALGDLDWFYSQTGELRRPELVNEVGEDGEAGETRGDATR